MMRQGTDDGSSEIIKWMSNQQKIDPKELEEIEKAPPLQTTVCKTQLRKNFYL